MKVLIYDPFILLYNHFSKNLEIAKKHIAQGDEVHFIVCDSTLLYCETNKDNTLDLCTLCVLARQKGLKSLNINPKNIHSLDFKLFTQQKYISEFRAIEYLRYFFVDEVDHGVSVAYSLKSDRKDGKIDLVKKNKLIEKMLNDSINIYNYTTNLIKEINPSLFYLSNENYSIVNPVLRAAQNLNIEVILINKESDTKDILTEKNNTPKTLGDNMFPPIESHEQLFDSLNIIFKAKFLTQELTYKPLVSIIMNADKYSDKIDESIKSVINQTYQNIELIIIIIDNDLKDNRRKIIKDLIKNDRRIKYVTQNNSGRVSALNHGIKSSEGKYLKFIDSNDILFPHAIKSLVSNILSTENEIKIAYGDYVVYDQKVHGYEFKSSKSYNNKFENIYHHIIDNLIRTKDVLIDKNTLLEIDLSSQDSIDFESTFWDDVILKYNIKKIDLPMYIESSLKIDRKKLLYYADMQKLKFTNKIDPDELIINLPKKSQSEKELFEKLISSMTEKRFNVYSDSAISLINRTKLLDQKEKIKKINDVINKSNFNLFVNYFYNYSTDYVNKMIFTSFKDAFLERRFAKIFIRNNETNEYFRSFCEYEKFFSDETEHLFVYSEWCLGVFSTKWRDFYNNHLDYIFVSSEYTKEVFINSGIDQTKLFVANIGIDTNLFKPSIDKVKKDSFTFLFSGNLSRLKGIDILIDVFIESFSKNNNSKLVIKSENIYDLDLYKSVLEKIKGFDNIQIIEEKLSDTEIVELYNNCDCFVYPYRLEGNGKSIIEAMSCQLPLIVSNNGASLDFCNNENSYLLDCKLIESDSLIIDSFNMEGNISFFEPNKKHLKELMNLAYTNYQNNKNIGEKARQHIIDNFTWEKIYEPIKNIVNQVSNKKIFRFEYEQIIDELIEQGYLYFDKKDYINTEKTFSKIIAYKKTSSYYYILGFSQYSQNKYDEAIDSLAESLELETVSFEICDLLSKSLRAIGDFETAEIYSQKASELILNKI